MELPAMMSSSRGPHHLANTSAATPGRWLTTGTTRLGLYFVFVKTRSILLLLLLVRAVSLYFINKFFMDEILTARCYACAIYALALCPSSVCLSRHKSVFY